MLGLVKEKRKLLNIVLERKKRQFEHILMRESFLKEVADKRMEGKKIRERLRIMLLYRRRKSKCEL